MTALAPNPSDPICTELDGLPLADALHRAAASHWGGVVRVLQDSDQAGAVYLHGGEVAWAVSRDHTENFGHYLERIGMIPRDRFNEVVLAYKASGKAQKFGAMLEEAGLISHARLRECLKAHIRAALAALLRNPDPRASARSDELLVDARWTFLLEDVLPALPDQAGSSPPEPGRPDPHELLETLAQLTGYEYSFIAVPGTGLLAVHDTEQTETREAAMTAAITWLSSTASAAGELLPGRAELILLEHGAGSLMAGWTGDERRTFLAVAFTRDGKPGIVKHKLAELLPRIRELTAAGAGRPE